MNAKAIGIKPVSVGATSGYYTTNEIVKKQKVAKTNAGSTALRGSIETRAKCNATLTKYSTGYKTANGTITADPSVS